MTGPESGPVFAVGGAHMRLDKFLKVSRLIKRRTLAKEVCDSGRVQLSGRVAKAGTEVASGQSLTIDFGRRRLTVKVVELRETTRANQAREMYEVISEVYVDPALEDLAGRDTEED